MSWITVAVLFSTRDVTVSSDGSMLKNRWPMQSADVSVARIARHRAFQTHDTRWFIGPASLARKAREFFYVKKTVLLADPLLLYDGVL